MSLTRPRRTHLVLALFSIITAATAANPAQSDDTGTDTTVASLITSVPPGNLRPVTVIDRDDIALSGMRNLWDLLASRDEFNYFGLHRPLNLGGLRAAFLINGRRVSDSLYDLDSIPISAVERIEILSASAVAIHAPQASSGAINIVLRNGFEGVEAQVHGESPRDSLGEAGVASAIWGGRVGAGHLTVGADVFSRNEIRSADRAYSRASWTPGGTFDDTFGVSAAGNTGIVFTAEGPQAESLGPCEGSAFTGPLLEPYGVPGEGCGFATNNVDWTWEQRDRETAFLLADYPIIEDVSVYLDARVVDSDYTSTYRAPAADRIPQPGGFVLHRFAGHGDRAWRWTVDEHDITLGVEGRLTDDIGYDVYVRSFLHDEFMRAGTFVHEPAILEAIADGSYDLRNPLSTESGHLKAVHDTSVDRFLDNITKHRIARVAFDGSSFDIGGRPIGWAAGTELVNESREWLTTYVDRNGNEIEEQKDVIGSFGITFAGERQSFTQFLELSLPLHEIWDVGLAGRHSNHDDVGSTAAGQLETVFELSPEFALRGNWSMGDRAPYLGALHTARVTSVPHIYDYLTGRRYQVEAVNFGNPDLEPDRAESYGAGFVTEIGPVSLSADWYWSKLSRLLTIVIAQDILNYAYDNDGALPPGTVVHRGRSLIPGTQGLITRIEKPLLGDGEVDISGLDVHAHTAWEWDWADFELDASWSHVQDYEWRALDFSGPHDFARNRLHVTLSGTRGKITAQWHSYGVTGYRERRGRFGSWVGHDVSVRWRNPYEIRGTELVAGILNVFDAEPSINPENPEYPDDTLDSIRGRTFFVTFKQVW